MKIINVRVSQLDKDLANDIDDIIIQRDGEFRIKRNRKPIRFLNDSTITIE